VDDIKISLVIVTEGVCVVQEQQNTTMSLEEEVKALRLQITEKDKQIVSLEN